MNCGCQGPGCSLSQWIHPPTPNPTDEFERKHKQTVAELASLKNRVPTFRLRATDKEQESDDQERFECRLTNNWVPYNIEALLGNQRSKHAKLGSTARHIIAWDASESLDP